VISRAILSALRLFARVVRTANFSRPRASSDFLSRALAFNEGRLRPQIPGPGHFKPAAMRCAHRPYQDGVAMHAPQHDSH
jgi:hypothetical protein